MSISIFDNGSRENPSSHRENLIEADCESLERMHKVAKVQGFTIYCDESVRVGGEHAAPSPLGYFTAAMGF